MIKNCGQKVLDEIIFKNQRQKLRKVACWDNLQSYREAKKQVY